MLYARSSRINSATPVVLTAVLAWSGVSAAQSRTAPAAIPARAPDAQIEANVLKALAGAADLASQQITTTTVYGTVTLSGWVETEAQRTEAENIASRTVGVQKVIDELTLAYEPSEAPAQPGSQLPNNSHEAPSTGSAPPAQSGHAITAPGAAPGTAARPQQRGYPRENGGYSGEIGAPDSAGQRAGEVVIIPSGAIVRVRINQALDSGRTDPGSAFEGVVVNDVVAGGAVAIPRGATVQGTVLEAKRSGALAGRGEMSLQLTEVTLGGRVFPITSDIWAHHGGDKTIQSVNSTAVGSGVGAILGAAAGGGAGAAIGAGVGGALGLGASAASGSGQVYIPSEGTLTFHLAQPATVATVSQQEMNRLAQGAGPAAAPQVRRRYPPYIAPYPYPYYGPAFYRPRFYYPYPY